MKDFVAAEFGMTGVENFQLKAVQGPAQRVEDATAQKPGEGTVRQQVYERLEGKNAHPAHCNVQDGRKPFRAVHEEVFGDHPEGRHAPDGRKQNGSGAPFQDDGADRSVGAGNQEKDGEMIDSLEQGEDSATLYVYGVVGRACRIEFHHTQAKNKHAGQTGVPCGLDKQGEYGAKRHNPAYKMCNGTARIAYCKCHRITSLFQPSETWI